MNDIRGLAQQLHTPIRDIRTMHALQRTGTTELGHEEATLPLAGLLSYIRSYDPVIKAFPDSVGTSTRPLQDLQYIQADGTGYFTNALLTSSATIVTKQGTSTPGFATVGRMTLTAGTLWSFTIRYSDGVVSQYEFASNDGGTGAVVFDVSGNMRTLAAVGFSNLATMRASCKTFGSDRLNQKGWTYGGVGQDMINTEAAREFTSNDGFWRLGNGWSIANGQALFDGAYQYSNIHSNQLILTPGVTYLVSVNVSRITAGLLLLQLGLTRSIPISSAGIYTQTLQCVDDGRVFLNYASAVTTSIAVESISIKPIFQATCIVPASANDMAKDVLGNTLQYQGRAKYSLVPRQGNCVTCSFGNYIDTGISSLLNVGVSGYIKIEINHITPATLSDGVAFGQDHAKGVYFNYASVGRVSMYSNGVALDSSAGVIVPGTTYKFGLEYNNTARKVYINDVLIASDTGTLLPDTTNLHVGRGSVVNVSAAGRYYGLTIKAGPTESTAITVTFPLTEGAGTTVLGYDTNGNNYQGNVTSTDITAFLAGKQYTYFPGLENGCNVVSGAVVPANPYTPGLDCLGNPIQYQPNQINPSAKYSYPWSKELVAADTTNTLFDAGGTPKVLTYDEVMALQGDQIFASATKGVAVYATQQVDPALTKIKEAMKLI